MSTQQVLGVVGAAVGWMFGYPQLGFVVGSLVGAALTPKQKSEGPRLDDLKVTVSTYGAGIPTIYGSARLGGNVIFSTNKIEIPITTSSGGKGGGGSENTTYVAFVHMAVALCYGPIVGIRKMWKDGKLIYDVSLGGAVETAIATASSPYSRLTVYYGTETQLPDPVQEIYLGVGNAPPYRGIAYVQMNAVECPGGHIPQFSFEVIASGTNGPEQLPTSALPIPTPANGSQTYSRVPTDGSPVIIYNDGVRVEVGYAHNAHLFTVYALDVNYTSIIDTFAPGDYSANYVAIFGNADIDAVCLRYVLASTGVDQGYNTVFARDGTIKSFELTTAIKAYGQSTSAWAKHSDNFAISGDANQGHGLAIFSWNSTFPVGLYPSVQAATVNCTTTHVWTTVDTLGVRSFSVRAIDDPSTPINAACPSPINSTAQEIYITTSVQDTIHIIYKASPNTVVLEATIVGAVITVTTLETVPLVIDGPFAQGNKPVSFGNDLIAGVKKAPSGEWSASILALHRLTRVNEGVSDIISQQCLRAGLTAGQIDVSTITDTIHGYTIANPASARNNIQPLMTAYGIDATEEDGKIKFFKRSAITSVVTVPYVELGCVEGEGDAGDPMPLSHGQEAELPRAVNVNYINPNFDYQTGTERAKRQVTESQLDQTIDMPIGTNADHAASVAQMILYDAWNERNKRSAKVSRKYAAVSAGDGVTIEYPEGTEQRWRITKVTDTGALCEWEVVPADESIYTQTALGSGIDASQVAQVEPINSPTRATIVDSAMLRDVDNNAGPYVAMDGFSTFWTGAELFIGNTPTNVDPRGTVSASAPTGFLEANLGNWTSNEVDETNVLSVNVGTDVLDTITRDQLLNGTTNVAAVGVAGRWEIIKFQRATALGSGQYTLTGLLRGMKGTEHARAFHKQGDLFVLMTTAGVLKPSMDVGSIGQALYYVAVSQGSAFESGTTQIYSATGEPLRPYSPVNPRRSAVGNDITLSWDRRTRLSDNAVSGSIPLGEAFEAYEVDVYSTPGFALLKATLNTNVSNVTITDAQQTAWGLTPGAVISVRVYQMSDTVGRGRVLEISL